MQPETITNALRHLRAQIVRDRLDGLEHVEALLVLRGDNLPPIPKKKRRPFKRSGVKRVIIAMLREGPVTRQQVAERLMEASGLRHRSAMDSAKNGLLRLQRAGVVVSDERFWVLTIRPEGSASRSASDSASVLSP